MNMYVNNMCIYFIHFYSLVPRLHSHTHNNNVTVDPANFGLPIFARAVKGHTIVMMLAGGEPGDEAIHFIHAHVMHIYLIQGLPCRDRGSPLRCAGSPHGRWFQMFPHSLHTLAWLECEKIGRAHV